MAWARRLPSGRYQGGYRAEDGRSRTVGTFVRKRDAEHAAEDQERKVRLGEWVEPELARTTVETLARNYLEGARPTLKPKTFASYESLLRSRILPAFGHRQARPIKPSDVSTWVGSMIADGLSPSRIRQAHVVLRLILEVGVQDGFIARNPAVGVKLPRLQHREAPYFEPDVVDAIVDALEPPYDVFVSVLGICGPRFGEAAALRRRHVDGLRRRLVIEESLAEVSGQLIFGPTKSHARRAIPIPTSVLEMLNEILVGTGRDDLVFTGPRGGPLRYRNFLSRVWHPVLARLELPKVGVHVLRHSAAARMVGAGASPKTLQTVLGHRSAAFSLTVYAHLFDADLDALADRLDEPRSEGASS